MRMMMLMKMTMMKKKNEPYTTTICRKEISLQMVCLASKLFAFNLVVMIRSIQLVRLLSRSHNTDYLAISYFHLVRYVRFDNLGWFFLVNNVFLLCDLKKFVTTWANLIGIFFLIKGTKRYLLPDHEWWISILVIRKIILGSCSSVIIYGSFIFFLLFCWNYRVQRTLIIIKVMGNKAP